MLIDVCFCSAGSCSGGFWAEFRPRVRGLVNHTAYGDAWLLQAKLVSHNTLKIHPGYPLGMLTTHAKVTNQELLAFVRSCSSGRDAGRRSVAGRDGVQLL